MALKRGAVEVSVVIPTYDRSQSLRRCLLSLADQSYSGEYEVIVVDDGSRDDTAQVVEAVKEKVGFPIRYFFQSNRGPAAARNLGIVQAQGNIIAFIDDDHIASPVWLSQICQIPPDGPVVGLCGRNRSLPGRTRVARYCAFRGLHERPPIEADGTVRHLMTGNSALRTRVLQAYGGFDQRFRAAFRGIAPGGEDTALSVSLRRQGLKIRYNPDAVTDHHQKEHLVSLLKESFNFGCNRMLWYHLEGRTISGPATFWRFGRAALSVVFWPRHLWRFHKEGLGWTDSLVFSFIEKASHLCFEAGVVLGLLRLSRRLGEVSRG